MYAVTEDELLEELGQLDVKTVEAAPFLANECFIHVTPTKIALYEAGARAGSSTPLLLAHAALADSTSLAEVEHEGPPIVAASISDPFVSVRGSDNSLALFRGDLQSRTLVKVALPEDCARGGPGVSLVSQQSARPADPLL